MHLPGTWLWESVYSDVVGVDGASEVVQRAGGASTQRFAVDGRLTGVAPELFLLLAGDHLDGVVHGAVLSGAGDGDVAGCGLDVQLDGLVAVGRCAGVLEVVPDVAGDGVEVEPGCRAVDDPDPDVSGPGGRLGTAGGDGVDADIA